MHPLTTWLALAGSVWAIFGLAEDHLTAVQRRQMIAWLRRQTPHWTATAVALCDSLFGQPTLSGAYVLRVCVATQIAAFLVLCLSGVYYPGTSGSIVVTLLLYAPFLVSALAVVNWLPGLGALLLVQALLLRAASTSSPLCRGLWYGLLVCTTGGCALLAWVLGLLVVYVSSELHLLRWPVTWLSGYVEFAFKSRSGALSVLQDAVCLRPVIVPHMIFPSFGIWLYAPCFPLIWTGLYRLTGGCIRAATALGLLRVPGDTDKLLDSNTPQRYMLGAVAVGIVSTVYWTAVLWRS